MQRVGPYQLQGELARGGFGVVYRAVDAQGRTAALKLLRSDLLDPGELLRFEREAEAHARLRDPGLVQVLGAGLAQGRPWLATELVEGEDLQRRLARSGPFDPADAARIAAALARTLARLHRAGVLHRDLKPSNVLLGPDGSPMLLDLGLALLLDGRERLTRTGEVVGTPAYLPPERAQGIRGLDGPEVDVYGLGAVLYALLCGRPPHTGATTLEVLQRVVTESPPPPSRLRDGIDPALEAVCLRCMARSPLQRPADLEALAGELEALAGGSRTARRSRPARGRRWLAPVGVGALALAAVALGAVRLGRRGHTDAPSAGPGAGGELATLEDPSAAPLPRLPGPGIEPRQALALLDAYLVARPGDATALLLRGEFRARLGDLTGARQDVEEAAASAPQDARVWVARGRLHEEEGDQGTALDCYQRALGLDPGNGYAWTCLGVLRGLRGELALAREALEKAATLVPGDAHTLSQLGLARIRGGEPRAGLEACVRAQAADPAHRPAWRTSAQARALLGDLPGALADRSRAVELAPQDPVGWLERAMVRQALGDWAGMRSDLDRALELDPGYGAALGTRAVLRLRAGDRAGARADLDQAVAQDPRRAEHWSNRARLRLEGGDLQGALADCDRAVALAPELAGVRVVRGDLRYELGDLQGAQEDYEWVLRLDPRYGPAWGGRAKVRQRQGDLRGAVEDLQECLRWLPERDKRRPVVERTLAELRRRLEGG